MNNILFTTSWDDGSVLDLKLAELLSRYGVRGTFYIPKHFDGEGVGGKFSEYARRLTEAEIVQLASQHEIGGHSLTHRRLTDLNLDEVKKEISGSKAFLESVIKSPITMFSPPGGKCTDEIIEIVKGSGFLGVRTTKKLATERPLNPFILDVTVACHPFPFRRVDSTHFYWRRILDPVFEYQSRKFALSWLSLAKKMFQAAAQNGGYFHLYGHSWELEKYAMWNELELFLKFVTDQSGVLFLTNGQVVTFR